MTGEEIYNQLISLRIIPDPRKTCMQLIWVVSSFRIYFARSMANISSEQGLILFFLLSLDPFRLAPGSVIFWSGIQIPQMVLILL